MRHEFRLSKTACAVAVISVLGIGFQNAAHADYWMDANQFNDYRDNVTKNSKFYRNPKVYQRTVPQDYYNYHTGGSYNADQHRIWVKAVKKNNASGLDPSNLRPDIELVKLPEGDDFIFISGWIDKVYPARVGSQPVPDSEALPGCVTSQPTITSTDSFSASAAVGGFTQDSITNTVAYAKSTVASDTFGYDYGLEGSGQFMGVGPKASVGVNWSYTTSRTIEETLGYSGTSMQNVSYNNISSYTKSWSVTQAIPLGTVGTKSFSSPAVIVKGVFRLARLLDVDSYKYTSDDSWNLAIDKSYPNRATLSAAKLMTKGYGTDPNESVYPIFSNELPPGPIGSRKGNETVMMGPKFKSGWYSGTVSLPQHQIAGVKIPGENTAAHTIWFVDSPLMTVPQYKLYCKGDILNRQYAPSMKASLCRAGVDKVKTCQ